VNFFISHTSAAAWAGAHPEVTGVILDQIHAEELGRRIFGSLLTSAA